MQALLQMKNSISRTEARLCRLKATTRFAAFRVQRPVPVPSDEMPVPGAVGCVGEPGPVPPLAGEIGAVLPFPGGGTIAPDVGFSGEVLGPVSIGMSMGAPAPTLDPEAVASSEVAV